MENEIIFIYGADENGDKIPDKTQKALVKLEYKDEKGEVASDKSSVEFFGKTYKILAPKVPGKCVSRILVNKQEILNLKYPIVSYDLMIENTENNVEFIYSDDVNNNGIPDKKEKYKISQKLIGTKTNGEKIELNIDTISISFNEDYKGIPTVMDKWVYVGYKVDNGTIEKGNPVINAVGKDYQVEFIYEQDENQNSIVDKEEFDLSLKAFISKVIITQDGKTSERDTGITGNEQQAQLTQIDIDAKKINNTEVRIVYTIKVKNEGLVEGVVDEIKCHIPKGLKMLKEYNPMVEDIGNGIVLIKDLQNTIIRPGETVETQIILMWDNSSDNMGIKNTTIEISKHSNNEELNDIDSTPDNKKEEDDLCNIELIIAVKTGMGSNLLLIVISILAVIVISYIIIKKAKFVSRTRSLNKQ